MGYPDFFLASTENDVMVDPRACWRVKRLKTTRRDDILLVRIEPPLPGSIYGINKGVDNFVILAPKWRGRSLFPVSEWPLAVHVGHLLITNPEGRDKLEDDEFVSVSWAQIWPTEQGARRKAF